VSRTSTALVVGLLLALAVTACGSSDPTIKGIVVNVQGDLVQVAEFTVLDESGDLVDFVPAPDLRFHDGAPLSHLTEHLRNGDPIAITYRVLDDGTKAALRVEDVGG
jgi:hypothetical protein